ncbi:vanadium-dependent haloperoxidase [Oligoflexus tunisiensis]|uniref:vanadium-dependent haloperoxidase n=1 Tax=Oligoflexus tunisiensis TaxID=708132 RepID=UPI00159F2940|nr:vanadium-dependent haloperoxidase [Oligoflexus tunisiensis]
MRVFILCLVSMVLSVPGFAHAPQSEDMKFVTTWNEFALDSIRQRRIVPPLAVQYLAAMHLAMFEAANRSSGSYLSLMNVPVESSPGNLQLQRLQTAAAAFRVLKDFAPPGIQEKAAQTLQEESLVTTLPEEMKLNAMEEAYRLSDRIISERLTDPGTTSPSQTFPVGPGYWVPTPPLQGPYLLPGWGRLQPWILEKGEALRPLGPPALNSAAYAAALDEVRRLGSKNSTERTAEQTETAFFWADGAGTSTPPGHWNTILKDHLAQCDNDLVEITRIHAILNMAMADACIAAWDSKWHFYFWRPITAIREANQDGNPFTEPDPSWESLLDTPPFPAYVSGHAAVSGTAAVVLTDFFQDRLPSVRVTSEVVPVVRQYPDFAAAAHDAARSRVYGGIHYEFDGQDGLHLAQSLGQVYHAQALPPRPGSKAAAAGRVCR